MTSSDHAGLLPFFRNDHRHCDALWAEVEAAAGGGDEEAGRAWHDFSKAICRHFEREEQVLFPAFEDATGMHGMGPTHVMRMEHEQMRGVLREMAAAAADHDWELLVDHGDTLLMLIQQHNVKEEGMLYPMAEQHLAHRWEELRAKL